MCEGSEQRKFWTTKIVLHVVFDDEQYKLIAWPPIFLENFIELILKNQN